MDLVIQFVAGLLAGVFAGLTGAGGGILLVPILVWLGFPALAATATSNVAISLSAASGTWTNWRKFALPWRRVMVLAIPAVLLAPLGVWLAHQLPVKALLIAFAVFDLVAIGLLQLRVRPAEPQPTAEADPDSATETSSASQGSGADEGAALSDVDPTAATAEADPDGARTPSEPPVASDSGAALAPAAPAGVLGIGAGGGLLAGLFGVGGGLIMVPMQVLALRTPVRLASRISLAVVLFASISAVLSHVASGGDVRWSTGLVIAVGGLVGAPIGARWLHRFSDEQSTRLIQLVLLIVAISFFWRAWAS